MKIDWKLILVGIVSVFITVLAEMPETILHLWIIIPQEFRDKVLTIEGVVTFIVVLLISSTISKVLKLNYFKGNLISFEKKEDIKENNKEEGE